MKKRVIIQWKHIAKELALAEEWVGVWAENWRLLVMWCWEQEGYSRNFLVRCLVMGKVHAGGWGVGAGEGGKGQAWWALLCILIFKTRAMTNPLKNFRQGSAMFRFLSSHQESDDSEHFGTFTFPGDILLMEQWLLLLYSCCEFGMKSGRCTEGEMLRWGCEGRADD